MLSLLTACGTHTSTNVVVPIETPKLNPPLPRPLDMRPLQWHVIDTNKMRELLKQSELTGQPIVYFALSARDYENLALNVADLRRYIEQSKQLIVFYRNQNNATDNTNNLEVISVEPVSNPGVYIRQVQ